MEFIDPSKFKSLKKNAEQPWSTFDPGEYMSGKSFRVGQTPDGNTVFMMVLINPHEGACWAGVICPEDKFQEMSATLFENAQPVLSDFLQDWYDKEGFALAPFETALGRGPGY
jgi:hypothetical protein